MKITIYIEGGSSGKQNQSFRLSLQSLFKKIKNNNYSVKPCKDTDSTIREYNKSFSDIYNVNILIVDSEDFKSLEITNTEYIKIKFLKTIDSESSNHHLMVQCMESLFFADTKALRDFFDDIPKNYDNRNCECLSKKEIYSRLNIWSRHKRNREYDKIIDGSIIIDKIDPSVVRRNSIHFNLLCSRLEEL